MLFGCRKRALLLRPSLLPGASWPAIVLTVSDWADASASDISKALPANTVLNAILFISSIPVRAIDDAVGICAATPRDKGLQGVGCARPARGQAENVGRFARRGPGEPGVGIAIQFHSILQQ